MTDTALLRALPSVDEVLKRPETRELLDEGTPRWAVTEAIRVAVDGRRVAILAGAVQSADEADVTAELVLAELEELLRPALRKVINATGVVVHTNLGRAPLAPAAFERLRTVTAGYSNLVFFPIFRDVRHPQFGNFTRFKMGRIYAINLHAAAFGGS